MLATMRTTTILLIEDDPRLLAAVGRYLSRTFPFSRVVLADTSSRAIAVLTHDLVDLVVSDYDLGPAGGCGVDVLTWVRVNQPDLCDRFVFLTGSEDQARRDHDRVLAKGGPIKAIGACLREMMTPVMV